MTIQFPLGELTGKRGFFMFAYPGDNWGANFGWNLMVAGWLWAAWAGGAKTLRNAMATGQSPIYRFGTIDINLIPDLDDEESEPEKPRPTHLKLVP